MPENLSSAAVGAEQARPVTIKAVDNGPLQIKGTVELVDHDGNHYPVGRTVFLCRCGGSTTKPFCDGTHAKTGFAADDRAPEPEDEQHQR